MAALASACPPGPAMENRQLYDSEQLEGVEGCSNIYNLNNFCSSILSLYEEACFCNVKLVKISHTVLLIIFTLYFQDTNRKTMQKN